MGNKDNIIYNNNDETIGYYSDLYAMFYNIINDALKSRDIETAKEYLEYLDELGEWANYDSLLIISMANGMGFIAKAYEKKGE